MLERGFEKMKENKTSYYNMIISFVAVFLVLLTLVMVLQGEEQKQKIDKNKAVTYAPARVPSGLTYQSERHDIVLWARAQKDYSTEGNSSPISAYHAYYGWSNQDWCQLFINWCGAMVGVDPAYYNQSAFACPGGYDFHNSVNGEYRKTSSSAGIMDGWLIYETYGGGAPTHVGMYVGGGEWIHGNYNTYYVRLTNANWGTFIGYAKPFYRSKVTYIAAYGNYPNGRVKGAGSCQEYFIDERSHTLTTDVSNGSHKFLGWYTNSSLTGDPISQITVASGSYSEGATVYAGWKKTDSPITYVTYGGTINDASYITKYTEGETPALPMNVTRDGCKFLGWSLEDPPTGTAYSSVQSGWTGAKTLYAKYEADISYVVNRGVFSPGYIAPATYYPRVSNFALPQEPYFTRDYCDFAGWYADSTMTTGPYRVVQNNDESPWNKNITLYASWIGRKYEIKLHTRGGTVTDKSFTYDSDRDLYIQEYQYVDNIPPIPLPTKNEVNKDNYAFDGWYKFPDFSGSTYTETEQDKGGDYDFYSRWTTIKPNTSNSDHVEVVGNVMNVYVYNASREIETASGPVRTAIVPIGKGKRFFDVDILVLGSSSGTISNDIRIQVSKSTNPSDISPRQDWRMESLKGKSCIKGNAMFYTTKDNNTIRVYLPDNVDDFIGATGSKRIYFHIVTGTGASTYIPINLIKRTVYGMH